MSTAPFDEQGRYVPWGSVERIRVEPFIATNVLPNWLSIYDNAGGSANWSMGAYDGTTQYVQVNTPNQAGNYAVVNINDNRGTPVAAGGSFMLDLMEIRLGMDGLTFSHDETQMDFGINITRGDACGCKLRSTTEGTYFEARNAGTLTPQYLEFNVLQNGEWAYPHNLEFIVRPDRWVVLRENGMVVAAHQFTAAEMALGRVQPKPALVNQVSGAARWMRFNQFTLTLCH